MKEPPMLAALLLGMSYGFTAGISPGPLLGLTITQSLQRGWRAGSFVALAPLCTDLPIILLAVFLVGRLPRAAFGWLGLAGALFIVYLAAETSLAVLRRADPLEASAATENAKAPLGLGAALRRGILTNVLSPSPYLFWGTVGAPIVATLARAGGPTNIAAFLAGFYGLLVGIKLVIAQLVSRSRAWLRGPTYRVFLLASGVLLLGLAALLVVESLPLLG
jgi:threonine/homoserine/homoserine lactone efflux protein